MNSSASLNTPLETLIKQIEQIILQASEPDNRPIDTLALTCVNETASQGIKNPHRLASPALKSGLSPFQIRTLTRYIDERLSTDIRLVDLAELVGLSPYYFARSFTVVFGTSPYQHILLLRIKRAQQMMLRREAKLLDIALAVGFAGASQFSRAFRKMTGVTPSQWRGKAFELNSLLKTMQSKAQGKNYSQPL